MFVSASAISSLIAEHAMGRHFSGVTSALVGLTAFLAQFVLAFGANDLVQIVDGIQNRIFSRVLEKVLIPHAELAISSPVGLTNPSVAITGKYYYLFC